MSDEQVSEEFEVTEAPVEGEKPKRRARRRHDVEAAGAAPKRRMAERRHDSEVEAAMDGWGNPFGIKLAPGWEAFWVSAEDAQGLSFRPWEVGCYGDPRILEYTGILPGKQGDAIRTKETTLYLMRTEEAKSLRERDPARRRQQALRQQLFKKATDSSLPTGQRGRAQFHEVTV